MCDHFEGHLYLKSFNVHAVATSFWPSRTFLWQDEVQSLFLQTDDNKQIKETSSYLENMHKYIDISLYI